MAAQQEPYWRCKSHQRLLPGRAAAGRAGQRDVEEKRALVAVTSAKGMRKPGLRARESLCESQNRQSPSRTTNGAGGLAAGPEPLGRRPEALPPHRLGGGRRRSLPQGGRGQSDGCHGGPRQEPSGKRSSPSQQGGDRWPPDPPSRPPGVRWEL